MLFSLYKSSLLLYNILANTNSRKGHFMHSQKTRVGVVVIISFVMAALRAFLISGHLERSTPDNNVYYLPENIEITAFTVVAILFALLFIYLGISSGRKKVVCLKSFSSSVTIASSLLAFLLIGAALFYMVSLFSADAAFSLSSLLLFVLTLLSALVFLLSALSNGNKRKSESFLASAALIPIIFSAVRILLDFIATSSAPMASSGAYHIVGLVAALLYFLAEGKSYVIETSAATFTSLGYVSIFFLLVYSLPNVILACLGSLVFDVQTAYSAVDLGIVVYIAVRLATSKSNRKIKFNEEADQANEQTEAEAPIEEPTAE